MASVENFVQSQFQHPSRPFFVGARVSGCALFLCVFPRVTCRSSRLKEGCCEGL